MESGNILFLGGFLVLPLALGLWSAVLYRKIGQRGVQETPPVAEPAARRPQPPAYPAPEDGEEDATKPYPQLVDEPRRSRFHPPRYLGPRRGAVKRMTPPSVRPVIRRT